MIKEVSKKTGCIIATGGGVIKNPLNHQLIKQNAVIVMLNRPLNELATDGRPISMSCSMEKLEQERLPIYNAWKDFDVPCSTPEQTACTIINCLSI